MGIVSHWASDVREEKNNRNTSLVLRPVIIDFLNLFPCLEQSNPLQLASLIT